MRVLDHLHENGLQECLQSAYKEHHSCETALVRVQNDILRSVDDNCCVILLLLDMSAAFDTVDQSILLKRLQSRYGISGSALAWFNSYLKDRTQFVRIGGTSSSAQELICGVPQGSVLGSLLYVLYTSPVGDIIRKHGLFSIYMQMTSNCIPLSTFEDETEMAAATRRIEMCVTDIHSWMAVNMLKLNSDKTELLYFHSRFRPRLQLNSIQLGSDVIFPSSHAKNIGVIFDSSMTMSRHINAIVKIWLLSSEEYCEN